MTSEDDFCSISDTDLDLKIEITQDIRLSKLLSKTTQKSTDDAPVVFSVFSKYKGNIDFSIEYKGSNPAIVRRLTRALYMDSDCEDVRVEINP